MRLANYWRVISCKEARLLNTCSTARPSNYINDTRVPGSFVQRVTENSIDKQDGGNRLSGRWQRHAIRRASRAYLMTGRLSRGVVVSLRAATYRPTRPFKYLWLIPLAESPFSTHLLKIPGGRQGSLCNPAPWTSLNAEVEIRLSCTTQNWAVTTSSIRL